MAYVLLVMWDIVVANIQVAAIILFRRNNSLQSCWLEIPLSVRSPEAITAFAGTITMTPAQSVVICRLMVAACWCIVWMSAIKLKRLPA